MYLSPVFKLYLFITLSILIKGSKAQPILEEHPVDTIGHVGGSVTFECTVRNLNTYNIIWAKRTQDGGIVYISRNWDVFDDNPKYLIHNDEGEPSFTLEIFNLEMVDEGVYECQYEGTITELLGSATLTVITVESGPTCQYVTVSSNQTIYDLNCVWSSNTASPPAEIYKNGELVPTDFRLNDRVISRQILNRLDQLSDFECRWTSPITGQLTTCRYQPSTQAPIVLGVEPYMNRVMVGQTARFECQAEMVVSAFSNQDITYSWSITRNGQVVDLGERQKGLMKQSMRIINTELADDGLTVMCTASSMDAVVNGAGFLAVYLPTSTSSQPTTKSITVRVGSSLAPRKDKPMLNTTVIAVIAVLLMLIVILIVVIIVLARSKTRREKWIAMGRGMSFKKNRGRRDPRMDKAHLHGDNELAYPDPNPDIIRAHSTLPPIYAMPDKSRKSSTMDGGARYPPRHYTPRRQSYGGPEFKETEFTDQTSAMKPSDKYPNPYEDIDREAVNDAKQMRGKSHTVSHYYQDSRQSSSTGSPRRYRGMKSAGSASMLYGRPEKPPRKPSLKNRKSWDQPGSIENLCNYAVSDTQSIKSFTSAVCEGDSYACVDDVGDNTMTSDYMDMNPVLSDFTLEDSNDVTRESELSGYDVPPLYAHIN